MKVDEIISLANGKNYLLLLNSSLSEENYFLSVLLDDKEEPTSTYAVLKEVIKDGETYVQKIDDVNILNDLLKDYQLQYDDEYEDK
jgi:hypothetical protein